MLSPQEYADLSTLRESPIPISKFRKTRSFKSLKDKGYFECKYLLEDLGVFCVITTLGNDELSAFEKSCQEYTDKKRQQRFDNKIAIASVLIPLITFILGLFVEHWAGIAQWFLSLF